MSRGLASRPPQTAIVARLNNKGLGEVDIPGRQARIHHVLEGEQIVFRRRRRRRGYDEAELVELLESSAHRVDPRCPHFGNCGGCSMQHIDADHQVRLKQAWYQELLGGYPGLAPGRWLAPLTGPQWGYRRRARLGVKKVDGKGRVLVGFREVFKSYVADMDGCEILAGRVGQLISPLCRLIDGLSINNRLPQIEVAVADNVTALVLRVLDDPSADDLAALRRFSKQHDVRFYLQRKGLDSVKPVLDDAPPLHYRIPTFELEMEFSPIDFIQVNGALNEKMLMLAIDLLALDRSDHLLDLFCGLGNFSLAIARHCGRVTGVEGDEKLIGQARENAKRNNIKNARFLQADLFQPGENDQWRDDRYSCVLLDPPRSGANEALRLLPGLGARRIVYVSCNPVTLARDSASLVELGYDFVATGIMDMFPQTRHAEAIALFEQRD